MTEHTIGPFGNPGTINAPGGVITDVDRVTQRDLDSEVFSVKVDTLVDLWITRYGHDWVDISEVLDDAFYALVHKRLRSLGELEVHYLTDRSRFVCRMPE